MRSCTKDVIAALGAVEELRLKGAFESLRRYFYFDGGGGMGGGKQKAKGENETEEQSVHGALSIKAGGFCLC
jgi:hypothetical protein